MGREDELKFQTDTIYLCCKTFQRDGAFQWHWIFKKIFAFLIKQTRFFLKKTPSCLILRAFFTCCSARKKSDSEENRMRTSDGRKAKKTRNKSTEKNLKFVNLLKFFQLTKFSNYMIMTNNRSLTHVNQPYFKNIFSPVRTGWESLCFPQAMQKGTKNKPAKCPFCGWV